MLYQPDILLLRLLGGFDGCWQLIFAHVLCLRSLSQHWEYSSSPRFRCLRWTRMRKMTFSRWRAEVKAMMSSFALSVQLRRSLVLNGGC